MRGVGQSAEGAGGSCHRDGVGLVLHFNRNSRVFQGQATHHQPAGDGHVLDQGLLGGGLGLEFVLVGLQEFGEALLAFTFQEDGVGEEAVAVRVL